ncbi:MAG: DNA primase [Candidatus Nealsonbacteria bacterium]|nr:DNA primase [Candidatus Nealsonbacteria bacterium]
MNSPIDEIKNRLDILEVVREYVKLEKSGANYRALCPFHSEKTPSFFISPARQIWHCFGGCGEGGDIFKFIMKIEGVEFGDALRILARKAGVELKRQDPKLRTERERLYEISELANQFFQKQLEGVVGKRVVSYLNERGITKESIEKWRIGYAPDSWEELLSFLEKKGYRAEEVERAGLAIRKDGASKYYDRFRRRIIFPILDLNSYPIGFGGRIFESSDEKKEAKYLNTPSTMLYDKSKALYGLTSARIEIRKKDACILVEGYTDVIMSHQAGLENVVSTSGTALTSYQLEALRRYSNNLITAFDMDMAGDSATKRGIDLAQAKGFNIKVANMPEGLDPADIVLKDPNLWIKAISDPISINEFYFQNAFSRSDDKTPEGKKEIAKALLPVIAKISNDIEKDHWVQELSRGLSIDKDAILKELNKNSVERIGSKNIIDSKEDKKTPRKNLLEERSLIIGLKIPGNFKNISKEDRDFFSKESQEIMDLFDKPLEEEIPPAIKEKIDYLSMKAEIDDSTIEPKEELNNCLREIRMLALKKKLNDISKEIKGAEEKDNHVRAQELSNEFNLLCQELQGLQGNI